MNPTVKKYAILGGIAALGLLAGVWARGFSDAKGWTNSTP